MKGYKVRGTCQEVQGVWMDRMRVDMRALTQLKTSMALDHGSRFCSFFYAWSDTFKIQVLLITIL